MSFARYSFSVVAAVLGGALGGAHLIGCGDEAPPTDAPTAQDDGGVELINGPLTVSDARTKLFLGQTIKLDTIAPNIVTEIAWDVIEAPSTSALAKASAQTAPSFKPDALGTFVLRVSGRKDDVRSSVVAFFEVLDAPVFWVETGVDTEQRTDAGTDAAETGTRYTSVRVGGASSNRARDLSCAEGPVVAYTDDFAGRAANFQDVVSPLLGGNGADAWEAPAGGVHRYVYPGFAFGLDRVMTASLTAIRSDSACGSENTKVIESRTAQLPADPPPNPDPEAPPVDTFTPVVTGNLIYIARFSPDGSRVGYVEQRDGKTRLSAVGFDGSAKRVLSPAQSVGGTLSADASAFTLANGWFVGPRWRDATHLGWVTFLDRAPGATRSKEWEVYVVEDREGAVAERVMHCALGELGSFDFAADGSIVATVGTELNVYRANDATKECEVVRNLSKAARDLALSPDRSTAAFFGGAAGKPLVLFTALVDGTVAAAPVPGAPDVIDARGLRWAAGGTVLTWSQPAFELLTQMRRDGAIFAIPASGGTPLRVAGGHQEVRELPDGDGEGTSTRSVIGIASGCSFAPGGGGGTGASAFGAALLLVAFAARRERAHEAVRPSV